MMVNALLFDFKNARTIKCFLVTCTCVPLLINMLIIGYKTQDHTAGK